MSIPLRILSLSQNWDCHSCGACCRIEAMVSAEEKSRIEALDLAGDAAIGGPPWFVRRGAWWSRRWSLRRRPDGRCVFLTAQNRCRLQERFGPDVKPLACKLFPFLLIPAGDHWRVGLRFLCPSAAANQGRPLTEHERDLAPLTRLLEEEARQTAASAPPPLLQAGQAASWPDVLRFTRALVEIVEDRRDRLERRLRKCLALAHLCRKARFDQVQGGRLREFLEVLRTGLDAEVPRDAAEVPPPSWIGRLLFRTLLALFARRDLGQHQGPETRSRLARLYAGWRFVRGRGRVPRVNQLLPETSFEAVEQRTLPTLEIDAVLERYYLVKLNSLQFCGPPNFHRPFWDGLESLLLTLPMILWLARALGGADPSTAAQNALLLVDDHFGGNPLLGYRHIRSLQHILTQRGELERLIAWYSRSSV